MKDGQPWGNHGYHGEQGVVEIRGEQDKFFQTIEVHHQRNIERVSFRS